MLTTQQVVIVAVLVVLAALASFGIGAWYERGRSKQDIEALEADLAEVGEKLAAAQQPRHALPVSGRMTLDRVDELWARAARDLAAETWQDGHGQADRAEADPAVLSPTAVLLPPSPMTAEQKAAAEAFLSAPVTELSDSAWTRAMAADMDRWIREHIWNRDG